MLVSKKRLVRALASVAELQAENDCLKKRHESLRQDFELQIQEIVELRQKYDRIIEDIEKQESAYGDANIVKLSVSDSLEVVSPHVIVKPSVFDKMLQLGLVTDAVTTESKPVAMQIALMSIARDALNQILAEFEQEIETVD